MAHNQGSALLSALFIMSMVAIAATAISTRLQVDIDRTHLTLSSDKLYLASEYTTFWAMSHLSKKKLDYNGSLVATLPKKIHSTYPNVTTEGYLFDLQSRFNLNNLQDKESQIIFSRLLNTVLPNTHQSTKSHILNATQNWLEKYQPDKGYDSFFETYLNQKPRYYPSHLTMQSSSEWRLIDGVNATVFEALKPYLIALPEATPVNINAASKVILSSLGDGLRNAQAEKIIQQRAQKPFKKISEIYPLLQKFNIPKQHISLTSNYFLVKAIVSTDELHLVIYTLIKRKKNKKGKPVVSVVSRSIHTF